MNRHRNGSRTSNVCSLTAAKACFYLPSITGALFLTISIVLAGCGEKTTQTAAPQSESLASSPTLEPTSRAAQYAVGTKLQFGTGGDGEAFKGPGWSTPELGHTWSDKASATLLFRMEPSASPLTLRMRMNGFIKAPELPFQPVDVDANGTRIASWQVAEDSNYTAIIPAELVKTGGILRIDLKIPKATSPKKLGIGTDDRSLGVSLVELELEASP
jgi:hypothetical protein